jgi:hypothetical protein
VQTLSEILAPGTPLNSTSANSSPLSTAVIPMTFLQYVTAIVTNAFAPASDSAVTNR